jgi:hypothetical protein
MKQATIWLARNLVLLTVVTVVAAVTIPTPSAATEHEGMTQMVQAAKTAADHEALATQYDKRATEAKALAAEHRKMGDAYKGQPAAAGDKAAGVSAMPQHCEKLAEGYDQQAQMYATMAATERELAKAVK